MCEGGKLVKKAKEEVPQPFVIGCGGDPCSCSFLGDSWAFWSPEDHKVCHLGFISRGLHGTSRDPSIDKYISTLCRMPLVWQSYLWWKCCQGGRASTIFLHCINNRNNFCIKSTTGQINLYWINHRTFTGGGLRQNAPAEGWLQWEGLGGQWSQTRDIGDLENHRRSNFVIFSLKNIGVLLEKYTAALIDIYSQMIGQVFRFMTSGITGSGRGRGRKSHASNMVG